MVTKTNRSCDTPCFLLQSWTDVNLKWNPWEHGGTKLLVIPAAKIWLPDIILYNKYVYMYIWSFPLTSTYNSYCTHSNTYIATKPSSPCITFELVPFKMAAPIQWKSHEFSQSHVRSWKISSVKPFLLQNRASSPAQIAHLIYNWFWRWSLTRVIILEMRPVPTLCSTSKYWVYYLPWIQLFIQVPNIHHTSFP